MALAISSFPVPVSPPTNTVALLLATIVTRDRTSFSASLCPMISLKASSASTASPRQSLSSASFSLAARNSSMVSGLFPCDKERLRNTRFDSTTHPRLPFRGDSRHPAGLTQSKSLSRNNCFPLLSLPEQSSFLAYSIRRLACAQELRNGTQVGVQKVAIVRRRRSIR